MIIFNLTPNNCHVIQLVSQILNRYHIAGRLDVKWLQITQIHFPSAGESTDYVNNIISQMDGRWSSLNALLTETGRKIVLDSKVKEVQDQLASLQEILSSYEKWVSAEERVADEALEISRQLEQCRVSRQTGRFICYLVYIYKLSPIGYASGCFCCLSSILSGHTISTFTLCYIKTILQIKLTIYYYHSSTGRTQSFVCEVDYQ